MRRGEGNGGITNYGYWRITTPDQRRMLEHRYVIEKSIGRPLLPHEKVHHIDGNKLNNHLSNLEICTQAEHLKYHRQALIDGRKTDGLKVVDWSNYNPPSFRQFRNRVMNCCIEHCPRISEAWGLCNRHKNSYWKWKQKQSK